MTITENQRYWLEHDFILELLKQLPSYIFWKNTDCIYLGCNDAFAKAMGFSSPQEIIGKSDFDLPTKKEDSIAFQADDKKVMLSRQPKLNIEENQTFTDGRQVVLLTSKVPLLNRNNDVIGVLGIYSNITDRKKLEQDLLKAKEAAEAANIAKTGFIVHMSHDIKTPLTGIIGAAEALKERAVTEEDRQYAHMLQTSGQRLLELLNDVLDIISADNVQEHNILNETFSLHRCIYSVHDLLLPVIKNKNLNLKIEIDSAIPEWVISDRVKIERILLNLLTNAIKFTEKGYISIHVSLSKQKLGKSNIKFTISDTGMGIPKDKISQIFERFFRINPAHEGKYKGHGLGLYLVKNLVKFLGGSKIQVISELGSGTTFSFALPMLIGKPENAKLLSTLQFPEQTMQQVITVNKYSVEIDTYDKRLTDSTSFKGAKVLFIEDDVIAFTITNRMLHNLNCKVHAVTTAEAALQLAKNEIFDLVLTDAGLPGLSGIELAALLRLDEKINNKQPVPIIVLTAHATHNNRKDGNLAGVNFMLSKPIDEKTIQSLLYEFVSKKTKIQIK